MSSEEEAWTAPLGRGSPRSAFTLIEVMLSLALLSLGAFAIVSAITTAIAALNTDFPSDPMRLWAEDVVFALDVEQLEQGGTLTFPDEREIDYEAELEEGPLPDLMMVIVTLEGEDEAVTTVTRFVRIPGEMDEGEKERITRSLESLLR